MERKTKNKLLMKTRHILCAAFALAALAACNDDYNDQFDHIKDTSITGAITRELTLSSADYETIAGYEENKSLAQQFAAADTFPSCSPAELEAIGKNHYFKTDTAAQKFLPALLTTKYSHLGDDGSTVTVTYKKYRYTADYMAMGEKTIGSYTVSSADYETVWGDEVKASYLTPKTVGKIPTLLSSAISNPHKDSIVVVNYMYDDVEPSIGGGSSDEDTEYEPSGSWKELTVPTYPDGTSWSYSSSDEIDLSAYAGKHVQIAFLYHSTESTAATWEISDLNVYDNNGDAVYEYNLKEEDTYNLFTVEGDIPDGLSYVWSYSSSYGAKASAYASGTRYAADVYLCSPTLTIKTDYTCEFMQAMRYFGDDGAAASGKLVVREMKAKKAPKRVQTAASLGYNASTAYVYNGSKWEEMDTDDSRLVVVDPSAYVKAGSTYFSNPKSQIPAYLLSEVPYASKGDICTVIYKTSSTVYAMADYEFNGTAWSQNKDTEKTSTKTLKFQLADGVWVPNGAYYSNTLLGDDGGFTAKGIIPDGLTYIWTNTNSYGWKASAYANSTNYLCTAWLVSPAIDLTGADKPALTFDEAYRYINSPETANGLLKVFVTADYDDSNDESYADDIWTELEVPVRASGDSWTFVNVGTIDLSAYKDKTIRIAFHYESTSTSAATWEVKNVEIAEQ